MDRPFYRMRLSILGALSVIVFMWAFHPMFVAIGSDTIYSIGAQVGISVGVEPSEFSKLAQQVDEKQRELEEREAAVAEAEERIADGRIGAGPFSIEWYVTLMAFILLVLVLLNFYLDFRHREGAQA